MTRRTPMALLAAALIALPLLAGCGSGSSSGSGTALTTGGGKQAAVGIVKTASTGLGTILVDSRGRTIYLFKKDTGPSSTCNGACIAAWPAVTTKGAPHAASSAVAGKLGTTARSDGTTQITYAGHPLYRYSGDGTSGQTNGQGLNAFGAAWYVISPSGTAITRAPTSSGGTPSGY